MAIDVEELQRWVMTLDPTDGEVFIDEGGLCLVQSGSDAYLEVGGEGEED